jgi:hypothetical protein
MDRVTSAGPNEPEAKSGKFILARLSGCDCRGLHHE